MKHIEKYVTKYIEACQLIDEKDNKYLLQGIQMLKELAAQNYIPANDLLAGYYQHGIGCERDYELSMRCCFKSITHYGTEANPAWWRLGTLYMEGGFKLVQNYTKSYAFFDAYLNNPEHADEQRVGACLHHMGLMHLHGWGRSFKDSVRAYAFFTSALRFGYHKSQALQAETGKILSDAELKEAQHESHWRYIKHRRFLDNAERKFISDMEASAFIVE